MSKRTNAAEPAIDEVAETLSGAADAAAQEAPASEAAPAPASQAPVPADAEVVASVDPGSDRPAPVPMWDDHEHVPSGGGSFVRMPDGSLVKEEEA